MLCLVVLEGLSQQFTNCQFSNTHASDECKEDSHFELLMDSVSTSHMIKDIELFSDRKTSQKGNVSTNDTAYCANDTASVVEGRGRIEFSAKKSRNKTVLQSSSRKCSACPTVFKKLSSIKRLNVADAKIISDEKYSMEIENDFFRCIVETICSFCVCKIRSAQHC